MKNNLLKTLLHIVLLLFSTLAFSQQDAVSGTLTDDSGFSLPGVNVMVKGTNKGTQTDFDGNYTINCSVGDVLVFDYVGMARKEVKVTASMFREDNNSYVIEKIEVKPLFSDAYAQAIKNSKQTELNIPGLEASKHTVNMQGFDYERIRGIDIKNDRINLTYFKPDLFYEIGFTNTTSLQFIKNKNLPELQNTFAQGAPLNGETVFLGAETGNPFSYGPKLSNLEFDGTNYDYDVNGKLVSRGTGNGLPAIPYDNSILNTTLKTINNLFFNLSSDTEFFGVDFINEANKDVFDREKISSNELTLNYRKSQFLAKKLHWDAFIKYGNAKDNQPNINGFQNNLLLNLWSTPVSFSNSQGTRTSNNNQRSFSPNHYNNPEWLLDYNNNSEKKSRFVVSVQNKLVLTADIIFESKVNYNWNEIQQKFALPTNTVGFEDGYSSSKNIEKQNINAVLNFSYNKNLDASKIEISSITNFNYETLGYNFFEANGFNLFSFENPTNIFSTDKNLTKTTWRLLNKVDYEFLDVGLKISANNNSYVSSFQNNKWFLPTLQIKFNLDEVFQIDNIYDFSIVSSTSFDVNDTALFYVNHSHNSLILLPSESLKYAANADLFLNNTIALEDKQTFDIGTVMDFYLLSTRFNFNFTYFSSKTKGSVFPVFENNDFKLKNVADISSHGFEINLEVQSYKYNDFHYQPAIQFSTYRNKVTKLLDNGSRIPIAGFSTISKNLIIGQPAGVIVGSAYARDEQNNVIIDSKGFPIVAETLKIIGNPAPDFNIGFNNNFRWKQLKLNVVIDFQKGGDVWNGTQNVLNYFGTSQQSANERSITDYIFDGVDQQGNSNSILVDFANPENGLEGNRFVRYGFEGVAEDAIVDGSYLNLKSIMISYTYEKQRSEPFFRDVVFSIYANNLFTWSKFNGASPYSSLYNTTSGAGLNFFNSPIASEVGLKINLKI